LPDAEHHVEGEFVLGVRVKDGLVLELGRFARRSSRLATLAGGEQGIVDQVAEVLSAKWETMFIEGKKRGCRGKW